MRWHALPRADWRLLAAGGVLTVLAYPPFHFLVPSFICLVPAAWLITDAHDGPRPARRQLVQGLWFGLISQGLVLYWIAIALWHFTPMSALGYAATVTLLALYTSVIFGLSGWVIRRTPLPLVLVLPVLWTAGEWLLGHQGDIRFSWLGLGTSLTGFPALIQIADVIGARGITFLLVAANVALAEAWRFRATRRVAMLRAAAVGVGVVLALGYGAVRERTIEVREVGAVGVVQPNVAYSQKWDRRSADMIVADLFRLSDEVVELGGPGLIVWPEAAVPGNFYNRPSWRRQIVEYAQRTGTPMVVGALDLVVRSQDDFDYFNAAFLFDESGDGDRHPIYRKRYLVAITERVPFVNPSWFGTMEFFGGTTPGREGPVFEIRLGRFGVIICYESTFENLARGYRRDGADFLLNLTNDAWFGRTSAPYQHAAHLVMRAIENRMGIARAANTGISEWVDPLGRVHGQTSLYAEATAVYRITTTDVTSIYVRLGDWVGLLSLVLSAAAIAYAWSRR